MNNIEIINLTNEEIKELNDVKYVIDKAIEIVKHEDISDDVCECKKHRVIDNIQMYSTSCLHELEVRCIRKYKYCPYCGKRIKVME